MRTCKEISKLASESLDRDLSFRERVSMKLHLMMCKMCRRYATQLTFISRATKRLLHSPDETMGTAMLSEQSRERINKSIMEKQENNDNDKT